MAGETAYTKFSKPMELFHAKNAELERIKEDLRQAKEDAMQSWLDSRPLIDDFEKMQAELESSKARLLKANTAINELQAQLGTIDMCIDSAKNEEQSLRMIINNKNQILHKMQQDLEQLKAKIDQKRRRRSKLKLVLRLKRQTLQTLELTSEAMKQESEAFSISAAQAFFYINNSEEAANIMIQLTREEYGYLKREAKDKISLAEWRISVSAEEKLAAEENRDLAFRRMQSLLPHNRFRQSNMTGQTIHTERDQNNRRPYTRAGTQTKHTQISKGRVSERNPHWNSRNYSSFRVKRQSILFRIRSFICTKFNKVL